MRGKALSSYLSQGCRQLRHLCIDFVGNLTADGLVMLSSFCSGLKHLDISRGLPEQNPTFPDQIWRGFPILETLRAGYIFWWFKGTRTHLFLKF